MSRIHKKAKQNIRGTDLDITKYEEDIQNLISTIQENRGVDPKKVTDSSKELAKIAHYKGDDALLGFAEFSEGETYYLLNDVINFYKKMTSSERIMEEAGEWEYVVMANNMLGIMSLNRGNAPYAMDYYLNALSICQRNNLTNLEWIVNMNMGALYVNIEEYEKALNYIESAYEYVSVNRDMDDYIRNLTDIYVGMGKCYLGLQDLDKAQEFLDKIKDECMDYLSESDKIVVYSFMARLYNEERMERKRDLVIMDMNEIIGSDIPLMDYFDDIYEYLLMLQEIEYYRDFFRTLDIIERLAKVTAIKNLERKLLSLKIKYYRKSGNQLEYTKAAVQYFEITEYMDIENHNMVTSMIDLRSNYDDLSAINNEFRRKNKALKKKSETDALTKMANRFGLSRHAKKSFKKAIENNKNYIVEILDIDYFKQYNDNYGHSEGDKCIKTVAEIINKQRDYGKVFTARFGGDEFVIIYEDFEFSEVEKMVSDLKKRVEEANIKHEYSEAGKTVTISQGICFGQPKEGDKFEDFFNKADEYLYIAKEVSRNSLYMGHFQDEKDS